MTIFYTARQTRYIYNCTCTLNSNKLILKGPQYLIFLCLRLCSKKNSKEPNALHLRNPGYPAYDFHAKAEILQSPKSRIFSSETRELKGPWSGLQELGPRAQPATPCCVYQLFLLFVWFLVQSNIALFKPTKQSSAYSDSRFYPSSNAVDGNRDTDISKCTHTNEENNPWWRVDLGRVEPVAEVIILNRDSHETRLDGAEIRVGRQSLWEMLYSVALPC